MVAIIRKMSDWKSVTKDGCIVEGGSLPAIDWYSEEAKEQRRAQIRVKIQSLEKQLREVDQQ